ncbi:MAG TPA: ATP-binding protein [Dongiaceae bacterium]|nr:ATP-binding protein [Dongiaceae bacterium]
MKQVNSAESANMCWVYEHPRECHLLQGSPIPTFVIDEAHTIILWNRACEHISGLSADEMIGTRLQWKPFYPQQRPIMADLIVSGASADEINRHYGRIWQRSAAIEGAFESEGYFPDMGNAGTWLFFTASPLTDANGRIIGAIETLQDITARKQAEADLKAYRDNLEGLVRQRTAELAQTHAELVSKAAVLEQANEELSQYAFVASHDLRAPLRAVRNYSDFLREELEAILNEEQRRYFEGLGSALRHGDELVNDLLEFSRIGNEIITLQPIALESFLAELSGSLEISPDCKLQVAGNMPVVLADQTLLTQIFSNLVVNGFKFNRSPAKQVEIGIAGERDGMCELFVRDNGIGIDSRYHDRIFKMFKRLHTHKEFEGTGIGLAIVKKAAAKMHGFVRVESETGAGSTFVVALPLAEIGGDQ